MHPNLNPNATPFHPINFHHDHSSGDTTPVEGMDVFNTDEPLYERFRGPFFPFGRRFSSSSSVGQSSPKSGISWYSTDSESGIKISKAIDGDTDQTVRLPLATPKSAASPLGKATPGKRVFSLPGANPAHSSPKTSSQSPQPMIHMSHLTTPDHSANSQLGVSPPMSMMMGQAGTSDVFDIPHNPAYIHGLFSSPSARRAISEGGSPLNLENGLVLNDAAAVIDPYSPCRNCSVTQSAYQSENSTGTFSPVPFGTFGDDLFSYNQYQGLGDRAPLTFATLVEESDEAGLTSEDEAEIEHWLREHQDKGLSAATPPPLSPSEVFASPEYSREEGLRYLNPAPAELNSFRMATEELNHGSGDEQISILKGEISYWKEETQRLKSDLIRSNVTIQGILQLIRGCSVFDGGM